MPQKAAPPPVSVSEFSDKPTSNLGADQNLARQLFAELWPPQGWPMFACVIRPAGTVTSSDRNPHGNVSLLKYEVRITPDGLYTIEILQGILSRTGESSLIPALGIQFSGCEDWFEERREDAVLDIYVGGQRLIPERGLVLRMILAVTFLISRIDRGLAPNLKKTLKLYRLG